MLTKRQIISGYKPIYKSGKIYRGIKPVEFADKILEEAEEFRDEVVFSKMELTEKALYELADLAWVIINMLVHYRINLLKYLIRTIAKNERRVKKHK